MSGVQHLRPNYAGYVRGLVVDGSVLSIGGVPVATVTRTGSASDITTGVLPVAQVPGLDASKIVSGTIGLARLPPSSSNIYTGNNQAMVAGTGALPFGTGGFLGFGRDSTSKTLFANNRGSALGGWEWASYTTSGTFDQVSATLSSTGALTLGSIAVSSTLLGADGSIAAGGVLTLSQGSPAGGTQVLLQQNTSPSCAHRIVTRHYPSALAGNAIDMYLWTWGVDGAAPGSRLGLSVTQTGIGINNVPNPGFGVDCNGSANILGVIRGLGLGGLLLRVFDEANAAFPSSGPIPDLFKGRPVDSQIISSINYPSNSAGVAMAAGYTQSYSARISGYLRAPSGDTYTLSVFTDDGVRVWVNGQKVMDGWQIQATTLTSSSFVLGTAWVPFRVEYCQAAYGSGLQVSWRGAANNTSYLPLAHSASGAGFQMAYDNIERPPTSMGTTWFNGKAFFSDACGFGGQTTPSYPVDVAGSVKCSTDAYLNTLVAGTLGNAGTAAVGYAGQPSSGYALLQTASGATRVNSVAGQGTTFRDSDGIGMTYLQSSLRVGDASTPTATLDVAGFTRVASNPLALVVGSGAGGNSSLAAMGSSSQLEMCVAAGLGAFSTAATTGDCVLRAIPVSGAQKRLFVQCGSQSPQITIASSGLVGINTANPVSQLDVAGTAHVSGSLQSDGVVYLNNQANSCVLALSSTTSSIPASNSTSFYGLGMLPSVGLRYQVATGTDSHVFMTGTTEIARITNSGPGSTISGNLNVSGLATMNTMRVASTLKFNGTNTTIATSSSGDSLSITGGGGNKGIAVDYNSRVGVGTLSPAFPLDVVGGIRVQSSGAPAAVYSYANGQANAWWSAGADANNNYAISNQNSVGTYLVNGQTSWTSTSDASAKKNVADLASSLTKVMAMRPVSYQWKHNDSPGYGFIAQELQTVLPDIVDVEGGKMGIRYQEIIPYLVKAIQELASRM